MIDAPTVLSRATSGIAGGPWNCPFYYEVLSICGLMVCTCAMGATYKVQCEKGVSWSKCPSNREKIKDVKQNIDIRELAHAPCTRAELNRGRATHTRGGPFP